MLRLFIICFLSTFSVCKSQNSVYKFPFIEKDFEKEMNLNPSIYKVVKCVDGDTFWVFNKDSVRVKVRLIGVDAPEVKTVFNKKKHPFGLQSKAYLDSILSVNSFLKLTFDVDSLDRYGRTLAYVFLNDGTFLNEKLVRDGYATVMTISPNVMYQDLMFEAQVYARENKLGIWKE